MKRIEKLIYCDLAVVVKYNVPVDEVLLQDFITALAEEAESFKGRMMESAVNTLHASELRRFVRQCQHNIVVLSGRLLKYAEAESLVNETKTEQFAPAEVLCHHVYQYLNGLLVHLELHYGKYIFWNGYVPEKYLVITRLALAENLKLIEVYFDDRASENMKQFACGPLHRLLDRKEPVTFGGVRYLLNLEKELTKLMQCNPEGTDAALHRLLLEVNFNTRAYFLHCTDVLTVAIHQQPDILEKMAVLEAEAKHLRVLAQLNTPGFNRYAPSLVVMLADWIKGETESLEREYTRACTEEESTEEKIALAVSVAVLAAAIRAIVEPMNLPDKNVMALGRMLSRCFTTIKSGGSFSPGTFRKDYYSIGEYGRSKAIELFNRAIGWLRNGDLRGK